MHLGENVGDAEGLVKDRILPDGHVVGAPAVKFPELEAVLVAVDAALH